jgi:hypothetical protein
MKLKSSILAVCVLCLLSIGVLADDKDKMLKEHFEFTSDVMVGNTMVKKGFYLVKYNTETGTVKIVKADNKKKVVASAKATIKMNDKDFERDEILTKTTGGHEMLTALRLGGQKEELTLTENMASSR